MKQSRLAGVSIVLGATLAMGVGCEGESKLNVVLEEGPNAQNVNLRRCRSSRRHRR